MDEEETPERIKSRKSCYPEITCRGAMRVINYFKEFIANSQPRSTKSLCEEKLSKD